MGRWCQLLKVADKPTFSWAAVQQAGRWQARPAHPLAWRAGNFSAAGACHGHTHTHHMLAHGLAFPGDELVTVENIPEHQPWPTPSAPAADTCAFAYKRFPCIGTYAG